MRKGWLILILSVGVVAIVAGVLIARHHIPWLSSPTYGLVVAVGPQTEHGKRFLAAFNRQAAEEYPHVYFKVASFENLDAAGKALTDRSADLAVLRSDQPAAGSSGTLLILRKLVAAILVAPNASVENARDLKGKVVGVPLELKDDPLVKTIASFYGIQQLLPLRLDELGKALRDKRVAAVIAVGPVDEGALRDTIGAISKVLKKGPSFLDIEEAEAISQQYPLYETAEIPKGSFGSNPAAPDDSVDTLSVTIRLVARPSLPNRAAGEITRIMLATKAKLAVSLPAVGQIEAPDTDGTPVLPLHPGAATYLKGEQQSLAELFTSNVDVTLVFGLVASAAAGLYRLFSRRKPDQAQLFLTRLMDLQRKQIAGSDDVSHVELDKLSASMFELVVAGKLGGDQLLAALPVIEQMRQRAGTPVVRPAVASGKRVEEATV
jgi:TRAP-type uncharacterized transport system substrate-binding protein